MIYVIWFSISIMILLAIYLGIGAYAAITLTKVGDHPQYDQDPAEYGVQYEAVTFYSREDRLKITAWYLPKDGAKRSILLVHGRNASKQNAISGKLPELASELNRAGFAVLMIDLRGHGGSEGKRYTWGVFEARDVLGGVDFLLGQGFSPGEIGVLGISLGGAAAIRAAGSEPAIGALVVDSTFADLNALIGPNWKKESGLPMFFLPGVFFMWKLLFGFDLQDVRPKETLARLDGLPILILHSRSDEVIDVSHALQMKGAAPNATLVLLDSCSHAELYRDSPQEYLDTILTLFKGGWVRPE